MLVLLLAAACSYSHEELVQAVLPVPTSPPAQQELEWKAAQGTFERRCVVCHGCYDAPCQLKLSSWDGIARGATTAKVYEPSRLKEARPTRLGIDEPALEGWRARGFHPVLPEDDQLDPARSLLVRMLELKREFPQPMNAQPLPKEYTLGLDREEMCVKAGGFDDYKRDHAGWGMPYALPGLADADHQSLVGWVNAGVPHPPLPALAPEMEQSVARWEAFFNAPGMKQAVVSRYLYEHLFLGSLYFQGLDEQTFFRIVRSRTPSGMTIQEIPTRRPFESPGEPTFYYRLQRRDDTRLHKTQLPYALSDARMARYRELFLDPPYEVTEVPGYKRELASNPFAAFAQLPVASRYRFMLDDAQFIMGGFIKGPVCRGQVALNVIEDRFWILFVDPSSRLIEHQAYLLEVSEDDLSLPAEMGSNNLFVTWRKYADQQERFLKRKSDFFTDVQGMGAMNLAQLWDGGGNDNAALTVLRHFDSATVIKGLVGGDPKTTWVLDYSLFERIHYLLVAGYDVFGNVGHQLHSRMYMDFLRMEGEFNFLTFLPLGRRRPLMESWYRDTDAEVKDLVYGKFAFYERETGLAYQTPNPEHELYEMLRARVAPVLRREKELNEEPDVALRDALAPLAQMRAKQVSYLEETSFLEVRRRAGGEAFFTLLRDSAHTNVAQLFQEEERRVPEEDQLTLLRGFVGAYPNTLYSVAEDELPAFVAAVKALDSAQAYTTLRDRFGVRRTDPRFWDLSDRIHTAARALDPLESGLFDYNRLTGD